MSDISIYGEGFDITMLKELRIGFAYTRQERIIVTIPNLLIYNYGEKISICQGFACHFMARSFSGKKSVFLTVNTLLSFTFL